MLDHERRPGLGPSAPSRQQLGEAAPRPTASERSDPSSQSLFCVPADLVINLIRRVLVTHQGKPIEDVLDHSTSAHAIVLRRIIDRVI